VIKGLTYFAKCWIENRLSHRYLIKAKMMCCCINSLVQTQDNNANVTHARLIHDGISMTHMKASTLKIH